ncbi:MAG: thioredoxin-disulfide reductase [Halobacteriota archaeon]|nr:thioredoxin-disulfide reductase [Halobacteriota archaeon]
MVRRGYFRDTGGETLPENMYDVIIIGTGPAGLTAGLYCGRADLLTLVLGEMFDTQVAKTDLIENYPGFPEGISGMDLVTKMNDQARIYGVETVSQMVKKVEKVDGGFKVITGEGEYLGLSLIICTGASYRKLGIRGEEEFLNRGVSYCATCDGPLFRDKDLAVVGGGNTAVGEAMFLTKFAKSVSLIHRRDRLRADKILQKRALSSKKIDPVWDSVVTEIVGDEMVEGVRLKNVKTGEERDLDCQGVFILVGITPRTEFLDGFVDTDGGYIVVDRDMKTSVDGIYACGDVIKKDLRQVVNACGEGADAAFDAQHYVEELKGVAYK